MIVSITSNRSRTPGQLKGQIIMADDWDAFTESDDNDWYSEEAREPFDSRAAPN